MPIFKRAAISFSAEATSSACARLSSWHGPAMIEIGKVLPNLTDPAATGGAAQMFAFKALSFFPPRPCRAAPEGSTLFSALEYQGCAMGGGRRHHQPSNMALRANSVLPKQGFDLRDIFDFEAECVKCHPPAVHIG